MEPAQAPAEHTIKHLELIENVVTRLAHNSFLIKGWSVTLTAAVLALAAAADVARELFLVALLPAMMFWGLDAYYLRLERFFRSLYEDVRRPNSQVESFSMNIQPYSALVANWFGVAASRSILPFHGVIVAVVAAIIAVVYLLGS